VKKYEMTVNGKDYVIEITDANANPVTVMVNGQAFSVAISGSKPSASPPSPAQDDSVQVDLDEVYVPTVATAFVDTQEEPTASPTAVPASTGDVRQITAPMPGKVLDIAVQPGAEISHGDTLCNLEAMKMKSPIRAPADGQIVKILISEGQNVNFGDVLFTYQ
jgi:biotin carboxyl carrier protein